MQMLCPDARIVPVAFPPVFDAHTIGQAIGEHLANSPRTVVVASTDLTHYGERFGFCPAGEGDSAHSWMQKNDARMIDCVERLAAEEILAEAAEHHNACGPGAVAATLASARARSATRGYPIAYSTSFDTLPEEPFQMAVGYLGAVF